LLALLLPLLKLLDGIFGYVSNVETTKLQTATQVEVASISGIASVERRWWFVSALIPAFAIPYALYYGKVVAWDNVWMNGHSSTPALHGSADTVGWIIVTGLFLHAMARS
jgi:hypothetical protein